MVDRELSKRLSKYKIITGNFNTTLNFDRDTTGYLTDLHPKARETINGFRDLGKYMDIYNYFHTVGYRMINVIEEIKKLLELTTSSSHRV